MARIGYARVSTLDQDLDIQLAKLKGEGCEIIRSEKVSGGSRDGRPELATVLEFLRPGDEVVVTRLDRLGRDTRDGQCHGKRAVRGKVSGWPRSRMLATGSRRLSSGTPSGSISASP